MDIITAEEARELSKNFIPDYIYQTLGYVMEKIQSSANHGNRKVIFDESNTHYLDYEIILTNDFKEYMEHFGYTYEIHSETKKYLSHQWEDYYCYKWVTISW